MIVLSDGRNVFPEDVEPVLRADPAVKDCAVVGRPRGSGVEVHAVVIPAEHHQQPIRRPAPRRPSAGPTASSGRTSRSAAGPSGTSRTFHGRPR